MPAVYEFSSLNCKIGINVMCLECGSWHPVISAAVSHASVHWWRWRRTNAVSWTETNWNEAPATDWVHSGRTVSCYLLLI